MLRQVRRHYKSNMNMLNLNIFDKGEVQFLNKFILDNQFEPKSSFKFKSYNKKYLQWLMESSAFRKIISSYLQDNMDKLVEKMLNLYEMARRGID